MLGFGLRVQRQATPGHDVCIITYYLMPARQIDPPAALDGRSMQRSPP